MKNVQRWRGVGFLTVGLMLAANLGGCNRNSGGGGKAAAPAVKLQSIEGRTVELSGFRGKPVLVHFWASWCPPCLPELPHVIAFASRMKSKGWTVLAITTDQELKKALAVLPDPSSLPENLIVLHDPDSKSAEAYGSYLYPETYWVTGEGRIAAKWVGPQDWEAIASQLP